MEKKPTQHRMTRRNTSHDYSRPGIYHITIHVADGLGQPLGTIAGSDADTASVSLTPAGTAVEHELLTAITAHYPMVTVDAHVIMPEHLHFILIVRAPIISSTGRSTHLGQVIAGFKAGCNRAYWSATGQPAGFASAPAGFASAPAGFAGGKPRFSTGRPPLFADGYCDVQPLEPGQLEIQRAYISNNPRSRWLRSRDRSRLQPRRDGIDTALTPSALMAFLRRECPPHIATPEALSQTVRRLLLADGKIVCHSYGDRTLLQRRLLPVVCHRKDRPLFPHQKTRCLEEAAQGAVLVSARIANGEQDIIDNSMHRGFATVLIADNGFPDLYHPSQERIDNCAEGRLLIVTPWLYRYHTKDEAINTLECKTMNCVAQALCRLNDYWWKE